MNLRAFFAAVDAMDTDGFVSFFAPNAVFRMGNGPAVVGTEAIRQLTAGIFHSIAGIRHEVLEEWRQGQRLLFHGVVTYTMQSGALVSLPFAGILRLRQNLVEEYLVFIDPKPFYDAL